MPIYPNYLYRTAVSNPFPRISYIGAVSTSPPTSKSSANPALIGGMATAFILLVITIIVAGWIFRRQRRKLRKLELIETRENPYFKGSSSISSQNISPDAASDSWQQQGVRAEVIELHNDRHMPIELQNDGVSDQPIVELSSQSNDRRGMGVYHT